MDLVMQNLQEFEIPDSCPDYNVGDGRIYLCLTQQRLDSFNLTRGNSEIKIQDKHPYLQFNIFKANLFFELKFDLFSKPEWIKD